jgi:hypothetical protein
LRPDPARTAAPGQTELYVAPSIYLGGRKDSNFFNFDLVLRRGLASRVDAGVRANFFYAGADVKVQLLRAADPDNGVDLSIAPSFGYGADISWQAQSSNDIPSGLQATLPVMLELSLRGYQLQLSPQILYQRTAAFNSGVVSVGATIAFGHFSGPSQVHVYPALAIWKAFDATDPGSLRDGPFVFQPALVFRFGH